MLAAAILAAGRQAHSVSCVIEDDPAESRAATGPGRSPLRDRMVFVVGVRRSGTNWLQRVLCAHPRVLGVPSETYLFSHGVAPLAERFQHAALGLARTGFVYVDRRTAAEALRDLCDEVLAPFLDVAPGAERLVERTPDHVRHLGLIGSVYPDAWVVHIVRDGRDVARSLVSQPWGPTSLPEAAEEWRSGIEAARAAAPGLARYHEVRYEELLADPLGGARHLFEALGLPASDEVVRDALHAAAVPYNVDPASPSLTEAKWRSTMAPEEVAEIEAVAGAVLQELGYGLGGSPVPRPAGGEQRAVPGVSPQPLRGLRGLRSLRGRLTEVLTPLAARLRARLPVGRRRSRLVGERAYLDRLEELQALFHKVVEALGDPGAERLAALVEPDVAIAVVGPAGSSWEDRGAAAVERLAHTLRSDPVYEGRQRRGDVHPAVPTFVLVATYETGDARLHDRVVTVTAHGSRVAGLTYYRWPARPAPTPMS